MPADHAKTPLYLTFDISLFSKGLLQKSPLADEHYCQQRQNNPCTFILLSF